jgi:hypothetical protein
MLIAPRIIGQPICLPKSRFAPGRGCLWTRRAISAIVRAVPTRITPSVFTAAHHLADFHFCDFVRGRAAVSFIQSRKHLLACIRPNVVTCTPKRHAIRSRGAGFQALTTSRVLSLNDENRLPFPGPFVNARLLQQEKTGVTLLASAAIQRNTNDCQPRASALSRTDPALLAKNDPGILNLTTPASLGGDSW